MMTMTLMMVMMMRMMMMMPGTVDQQQRAGSLVTSSSRGSFCCTQLENSHNGARLACCLDKGSQNIWFLIHKNIFVLSFVDLVVVHGGPNMDWSNPNGIGFFQENCFLL